MHPARRQIVIRWAICLLALLSPLAWWWLGARGPRPAIARHTPPGLGLPSQADELAVTRSVAALERLRREQATGGFAGQVRASSRLLGEPRGKSLDLEGLDLEQVLACKWDTDELLPHLSLVFFSGSNRMAVIDGKVARQGSRLRDGSSVLRIERTGVLVVKNGKARRLVWHTPRQVRLSRDGS